MISIKDAVGIAQHSLVDLIPSAQNLLLEEVQLDDLEDNWVITLSYTEGPVTSFISPNMRKYKIMSIGSADGNFNAMRIRNV